MKRICLGLIATLTILATESLQAQIVIINNTETIVVRPNPPRDVPSRPRPQPPRRYKIKTVDVQTTIRDQVAKVQLSQVFQNTGSGTLEAKLIFPMPGDAAISDLTLLVDGKELTGRILKKDDARRIYEAIVRRQRDPALLEYMGQGLFQTSVFPVPPGAERKVEIRYTQLLKKENGLIDFLLPIGTCKHAKHPIERLNVTVRIEANDQIKTVYSPTHTTKIERPNELRAICKLQLQNVVSPDDFRLLYGTQNGLVGMNLISYRPNDKEDGYFALLASPEVKRDPAKRTPKTSIFVLDRSGSMNGKKIEQAREALKYFLNQLTETDTFNIVVYDSVVESFKPELQRGDAKTIQEALGFVDGIYAGGSTNIDGALQTALNMLTNSKKPNYILFLTDGLPTVGERNELRIAANAKQANQARARLFNFGVGFDVNSRLLDRLSRDHRGQSVYVRPSEDIEAHVSSLYNKIASPLLTDLDIKIEFDLAENQRHVKPINRTYPRQLTDLFHGEQLVWVGRYKHSGPVKITITGTVTDQVKTFDFGAVMVKKSMDETNGFVEKIWAARRIGDIIDELDLNGQNQELIDEMVRLSIRHGIITPYTSFLADETVSLARRGINGRRASEVAKRELNKLAGADAFRQRAFKGRLQQSSNAPRSEFEGDESKDDKPSPAPSKAGGVSGSSRGGFSTFRHDRRVRRRQDNVRNIGQKTFFMKNHRWQDSTVNEEQEKKAIRIKQFSKEYFDLAAKHGGTLAKYLAFDEPVILNLGNETYQIDPPEEPKKKKS